MCSQTILPTFFQTRSREILRMLNWNLTKKNLSGHVECNICVQQIMDHKITILPHSNYQIQCAKMAACGRCSSSAAVHCVTQWRRTEAPPHADISKLKITYHYILLSLHSLTFSTHKLYQQRLRHIEVERFFFFPLSETFRGSERVRGAPEVQLGVVTGCSPGAHGS